MSENDIECFASTGVNAPVTLFPTRVPFNNFAKRTIFPVQMACSGFRAVLVHTLLFLQDLKKHSVAAPTNHPTRCADRFNGVSKAPAASKHSGQGDFLGGQATIAQWMLWFARVPETCLVRDPNLKFLAKRP